MNFTRRRISRNLKARTPKRPLAPQEVTFGITFVGYSLTRDNRVATLGTSPLDVKLDKIVVEPLGNFFFSDHVRGNACAPSYSKERCEKGKPAVRWGRKAKGL